MEWSQVGLGNVLTITVLGLTGLIAYFGWQRTVDRKFAQLESSVETKINTLDRSFDTRFTALALQINTIMMRDLAILTQRITAVESDDLGMHKRLHQLGDDVNAVGLKVDRLERPTR